MARPLIGITCGSSALDPGAKSPQDRLNCTYSHAVFLAGGAPVILPNLGESEAVLAWLDRLDGIVLSGGFDVNPKLFGEDVLNASVEIDSPRDVAELPLIHSLLERDLPMLAICRGIQSLNVALGGTLYQDIPAEMETSINHRQPESRDSTTHTVQLEPRSRLAGIVGSQEIHVNTFHHQALKSVGNGLVVTARAPDGIIEAVEDPRARFRIGVQYHPEELVDNCEHAIRLFEALIDATRS